METTPLRTLTQATLAIWTRHVPRQVTVAYLAGAPVDWKSVKQMVVAVSTLESEYVALSKACLIMLHLRHLLKTTSSEQTRATVFFEDSMGAVRAGREPTGERHVRST